MYLGGCGLLLGALATLLLESSHLGAQRRQLLPGCLLLCRQRLCTPPFSIRLSCGLCGHPWSHALLCHEGIRRRDIPKREEHLALEYMLRLLQWGR